MLQLLSCMRRSAARNEGSDEYSQPAQGYCYDREWRKWVKRAPCSTRANYQEAERRYYDCKYHRANHLALSRLTLSSFPPLPPFIKHVDFSHNEFTVIPDYYNYGPKIMDFSFNEITTLENGFPDSLEVLIVTGNPLNDFTKRDISLDIFGFKVIYGDQPSLYNDHNEGICHFKDCTWESLPMDRLR